MDDEETCIREVIRVFLVEYANINLSKHTYKLLKSAAHHLLSSSIHLYPQILIWLLRVLHVYSTTFIHLF